MVSSFLMGKDTNIKKDSVIWNMIGGLVNAFQSVFLLAVMTRTIGVVDAGIFTIAFAIANLMLTVGKYGVRNYQVTDVNNRYSFNDYFSSRVISSIGMVVVSVVYVFVLGRQNNYDINKTLVILTMCVLKLIDSIEDVYHGCYQQRGRLDVAGRCITIRLVITVIAYIVLLVLTKNLLFSSIISTVLSIVLFIAFTKMTYSKIIDEQIKFTAGFKQVLKVCFPLFLASFLSFYVINAPKYAIDALLSQEEQAYYGFISMPVFVVGLLNGFIYQPQLTSIAKCYSERNLSRFKSMIRRQMVIVIGITLVVIVGAYLLGIPVLSILYSADLSPYKMELCVLMLGGGFLGMSGFVMSVLTLMRLQREILIGYGITGILAFILSPIFVSKLGLLGAATVYTGLMFILTLIFLILYMIKLYQEEKVYEQ